MREVFQVMGIPVGEPVRQRAVSIGIVVENGGVTFVKSPHLCQERHSGVYMVRSSSSPGQYKFPSPWYFSFYDGVLSMVDANDIETILALV